MRIRYRIIRQKDGTYSIEVSEQKAKPYIVSGFKSEAVAEAWATDRAISSMDQWERRS